MKTGKTLCPKQKMWKGERKKKESRARISFLDVCTVHTVRYQFMINYLNTNKLKDSKLTSKV